MGGLRLSELEFALVRLEVIVDVRLWRLQFGWGFVNERVRGRWLLEGSRSRWLQEIGCGRFGVVAIEVDSRGYGLL